MSGNRKSNTFSSIKRDVNYHSLKTMRQLKTPRYPSLSSVGDQPGHEADIILNRSNRIFYGHTGNEWTPLSKSGGTGFDVGFQATDDSGVVIDDNAAAGITTGVEAVAGGIGAIAGDNSIAFGSKAVASGPNTIAIGGDSSASLISTTALGTTASAGGIGATALGNSSSAVGATSVAVGSGSGANNDNSIAIGSSASANNDFAIALGAGATANAGVKTLSQLGLPSAIRYNSFIAATSPTGVIEVNIGGIPFYIQLYGVPPP